MRAAYRMKFELQDKPNLITKKGHVNPRFNQMDSLFNSKFNHFASLILGLTYPSRVNCLCS